MTDQSDTANGPDAQGGKPDVQAFARQALLLLAGDVRKDTQPVAADLLGQFLNTLRGTDVRRVDQLLVSFMDDGLTDEQIVFDYVPAAARILGEDWVADRLDFATVTIASARLQGIVHQLSRSWSTPGVEARHCLVIVPEAEQHTLGATILAARLRREGLGVQLEINAYAPLMAELVGMRDFAAVMITSGDKDNLENLKNLVQDLRAGNQDVPIIVGGSVLDQKTDVCRAVGADHATSNWEEALRICNLKALHAAFVTGGRRP